METKKWDIRFGNKPRGGRDGEFKPSVRVVYETTWGEELYLDTTSDLWKGDVSEKVYTFYIRPFTHRKILSLMRNDKLRAAVFMVLRQDKYMFFTYPTTYLLLSIPVETYSEFIDTVKTILNYKYVFYWLPREGMEPVGVELSDMLDFLFKFKSYYAKRVLRDFVRGDEVFIPKLGVYGEVIDKPKHGVYVVRTQLMNRDVDITVKYKDVIGV